MVAKIPVVYDVNVLVNAIAQGHHDLRSWPVLSPTTSNSAADCIGAANDNHDVELWLSPHILRNTRRVLVESGFPETAADDYIETLEEIAIGSGGQIVDPARTVHDCPDHEDNLILDLAAHAGASIIVSEDTDLTHMSPWRGVPVQRSRAFAGSIDARRRHQVGKPLHASTTQRLTTRDDARAARQQTGKPQSPASFSFTDHDPDAFTQHRQRFSELHHDLDSIVGSWNPEKPHMRPHIEHWGKNLQAIDRRITDIDELAKTKPDTAQHLLTELTDKMEQSVSNLEPHRVKQQPQLPARQPAHSVLDTFKANVNETEAEPEHQGPQAR